MDRVIFDILPDLDEKNLQFFARPPEAALPLGTCKYSQAYRRQGIHGILISPCS